MTPGLKLSLAAEVLDTFGKARLPVNGISMLPVMWPGDQLEIQRVGAAAVALGDVIVFRRDGRLVVHRVIRVDDIQIVTRGDHVTRPDPPVSFSEVLGRVVMIEHGHRRVNPRLSRTARMLSWLLSHSDICTRLAMSIHKRLPA